MKLSLDKNSSFDYVFSAGSLPSGNIRQLEEQVFYPLGNVLLLSAFKSVNICNYLSIPQVTAGLFGEKKKMKMAAQFLTRFGELI